jgi:hypothetical protein
VRSDRLLGAVVSGSPWVSVTLQVEIEGSNVGQNVAESRRGLADFAMEDTDNSLKSTQLKKWIGE